ncbi:hypothetical protein EDC01DRAFT_681752 [Geopyxis carbonaria]|nr:hypothetical protein EDC01DRAFT_681752 [Geopyxis carbonaria]
MEKLVDTLTSIPTSLNLSDVELSKQCNILIVNCLNKVTANHLASHVGGSDLLQLLNPGLNTLSYVFVLCAKLDTGGKAAMDAIWKNVVAFLEIFDYRQIRFAPKEFRRVVEGFCKYASDADKPIIAVIPLKKAILRSNPEEFSFLHSLFAQMCLKAKCFRQAITILDIDVVDFPSSKSKDPDFTGKGTEITYQTVLNYYLYGAILYMGLKNWRRALDFLSYVVVAPGNSCSTIQVEAYKKYVLAGLMLDGKSPALPKYTPSAAMRAYNALGKPYQAFANAFKSSDAHQFRQEIALTADEFKKDGNTGLAAQCINAFRIQKIIALQDTYVTLSVDEIAKKNFDVTGREGDLGGKLETERLILGMIERGEIRATLSQSDKDPAKSQTTVHFNNDSMLESHNSRALEEQIMRTVKLTNQVKLMDRKLGLSKEYIQFQIKQAKFAARDQSHSNADPDLMDFDYGGEGQWPEDENEETVMHDFDED